ncbi:MAG: hypothetical protein K2N26_02855, partial [Oscillospiraceae bacterium]|nr:hypothetical protein [Oscillospiraceae bacterium]
FSHYVPDDFSEAGSENYITAAIKNRVKDNISEETVLKRSRRMGKAGKIVLAAAAAVVVLITGTLAASAMGLIDLEKVFGVMFRSGIENLEGITAVPQNVVTTGDDRLSIKVLGIGGTENEAFGIIEIKRNDGSSFSKNMRVFAKTERMTYSESGLSVPYMGGIGVPEFIDDTTAIFKFRVCSAISNYEQPIIGCVYTLVLTDFADVDVFDEMYAAETAENENFCSEDALALWDKSVILRGKWSVSFPLEYTADYRVLRVEEEFEDEAVRGTLTEIGYSAISADVTLKNIDGKLGKPIEDTLIMYDPFTVLLEIKLSDGTVIDVQPSNAGINYNDGQYDMHCHYMFDDIIDVDSIKKIIIGDTQVRVK